jgi:hypothetical protein
MRDLSELNINEGGHKVRRPPPTLAHVRAFEHHFGVSLPDDYIQLLRHSNGGHPEVDSFAPLAAPDASRWSVNRFYHLDDDTASTTSLWLATERWRPIIGRLAIPFASDGGGNQFFLDLAIAPAPVRVCVHDENCRFITLASSFAAFVNGLHSDPEMI